MFPAESPVIWRIAPVGFAKGFISAKPCVKFLDWRFQTLHTYQKISWESTTESQAVLGILCEILSESCLWNFNSSNKNKSNYLRHSLGRKINLYNGYESQWINLGLSERKLHASVVKFNSYLEGLILSRQQQVLLLVGDSAPCPMVVSTFQTVNVMTSFRKGGIWALVAVFAGWMTHPPPDSIFYFHATHVGIVTTLWFSAWFGHENLQEPTKLSIPYRPGCCADIPSLVFQLP